MGRLIRRLRSLYLGNLEKQILSRAAGSGIVQLVPFDGQIAIAANSHELAVDGDALERAEYLLAFRRLCSLGMLEVANDDGIFRLTPSAIRRARKLAQRGS